jgi:hypothetical protein
MSVDFSPTRFKLPDEKDLADFPRILSKPV